MPRSEQSVDDRSVYSFATEETAPSEELAKRANKKQKWHKRFAYQKFKGWRPILRPRNAEIFFVASGILLIALGIPILIASLNVVEYRVPYGFEGPFAGKSADQHQQLLWDAAGEGVQHSVNLLVEKRMEPPIWMAFEVGTFFQNFRRYVRSYDPNRMHKGGSSGSPVAACSPFTYLGGNFSLPINPCGQIAYSFFNDSYQVLAAPAGGGGAAPVAVPLDQSHIAWSTDANDLYGAVPAENYNIAPDLRGGNTSTVLLNQNQHWMVWMRPGAKVAIQKLYARIDQVIEAGTSLTFVINNRYNTYEFGGAKTVIISTNSWVGGRNVFLGACYLAVGGMCLLLALFFLLGYDLGLIWKRQYGDMGNLSWLRQHAAELKSQQQFIAASGGGGPTPRVQVQAYQDDAAPDDSMAAQPDGQPKN